MSTPEENYESGMMRYANAMMAKRSKQIDAVIIESMSRWQKFLFDWSPKWICKWFMDYTLVFKPDERGLSHNRVQIWKKGKLLGEVDL